MKVLFYSPLAILSYHFETDLELIKTHIDSGDEVFVIGCKGELKQVGFFGCNGLLRCDLCVSKWSEGMDLISVSKSSRSILTLDKKKSVWNYNNAEGLKKISYKSVDIGAAVLSTFISNIRESEPDINSSKIEIDQMLDGMVNLVDFLEQKTNQIKPDLVYLFNGRFTPFRPILRICQQKGIKFFVHERAGIISRYSLTENTYPHDLSYKKAEIQRLWNDGEDLEKKKASATSWFKARRGGKGQSWYSFTDKQQQGLLPKNFDHTKRNIAVYISSEDEFSAIEGWENPFFSSQFEGVKFLLDTFKNNQELYFYIRVHPNLRGLRNSQNRNLLSIKAKNATILPPEDLTNSYDLMDNCEKVISFGSTIGAEAIFSGKPSILLGRTFYEDLDGVLKPASVKDIKDLILETSGYVNTEGILPYGYWFMNLGHDFKFFKPANLSKGEFMGVQIKGNIFVSMAHYFSVFFFNLTYVLRGQMSWSFLWNRVRNKIRG